jgi:hypothetical protein
MDEYVAFLDAAQCLVARQRTEKPHARIDVKPVRQKF